MRSISLVLLLAAETARAGTPMEAGFDEEVFESGLGQITDMAWATDGSNRLFVASRSGTLRLVEDGNVQTTAFHTFTVYTSSSETGLIGVTVDPDFATNGYVYAFTTETSSVQRIYRVTATLNGGNLLGQNKVQIGPDLPCEGVNHDGGSIGIGPDGYLYAGIGNLGNGNNIGGDGQGDEFTSLGSKIIRMDRFTGAAAPGNPTWPGTNPIRNYIWSRGWRNPFGLTFQPGTNALWVSEVGDSWEHIFAVPGGSNRGWPTENNRSDTDLLVPIFDYQRNTGGFTQGAGCLTKSTFYTGTTWPVEYHGDMFFAEYNGNRIVRLRANGLNPVGNSEVTEFVHDVGVITVEVGPDGALYYGGGGGTVYRLDYTNIAVQRIVASASGLTVAEGASGTFEVELQIEPTSSVVVTVAAAGNADVTVDPPTLTFTDADWDQPQIVTVSAAEDTDTINDSGTVNLNAGGLPQVGVTVTVTDNDTVNGAPTAGIMKPEQGETVSGAGSEFYGNGTDGETNTVRAEFYVDGALISEDANVDGHYHVGGDHNRWDTTRLENGEHVLRMTVYDTEGLSGSHEVTVTVANDPSSGVPGGAIEAGCDCDAGGSIAGAALLVALLGVRRRRR